MRIPQALRIAPRLNDQLQPGSVHKRHALLINPFYPKDPHADALAIGEGVQLWGQILSDVENGTLQPRYDGSYRKPYRDDPAPRRELLPRRQFLTTSSLIATRGCHNRCGFCYLSTDGLH